MVRISADKLKISAYPCHPSDPCAIYARDLLLPRLISGEVDVAEQK
jgi:hypothetical protein